MGLWLSCLLLFSAVPAVMAEESASVQVSDEKIQLLQAVGIIDNINASFDFQAPATRGDLAAIAVKISGMQQLQPAEGQFSDVSADDPNAAYIYTARKLGYMNGVEEGVFGADEQATATQAAKVFGSVLNADRMADQHGGYPAGYQVVAKRLDLFADISVPSNDKLTMGLLYTLAANALETTPVLYKGVGPDGILFEINRDVTLLSDRFEIYKARGRVRANQYSGLSNSGGGAGEGRVEIDGNPYLQGGTHADEFLGSLVEYYYQKQENGADLLVLVREREKEMRKIVIDGEDIVRAGTEVEYYTGEGRAKTYAVSETADVIVNGIADKTLSVSSGAYVSKSCRLTLLDTNSDGSADVVRSEMYVTYWVDSVNHADMRIVDKYGKSPLELADSQAVTVLYDGVPCAFTKISAGDILMVQAERLKEENAEIDTEKSEHYRLNLVKRSVDGKVEALDADKDEVTIAGKTYTISPDYRYAQKKKPNAAPEIVLHQQGKWKLDMFGRIAAVQRTAAGEWSYGFLMGIAAVGGFGDDVQVKLMAADGLKYVVPTAGRIRVNGEGVTGEQLFSQAAVYDSGAGRTIQQAVRFTVNDDGKLNALETAEDHSADPQYIGYDSQNFSVDYAPASATYRNGKLFGQRYVLNAETLVFVVPVDLNADTNTDEDYEVRNKSLFVSDTAYEGLRILDAKEDFTASVVVYPTSSSKSKNSGLTACAFGLVDSVAETIDADGNPVECLYYLQNGVMKQALVPDGDLEDACTAADKSRKFKMTNRDVDMHFRDLKRGDIIQLTLDKNNQLQSFRCMMESSLAHTIGYYQLCGNDNGSWEVGADINSVHQAFYVGYGEVLMVNPRGMLFNAVDVNDNRYMQYIEFEGVPCMRYDSDRNRVEPAKTTELQTGDRLFIRMTYSTLRDIVLIK